MSRSTEFRATSPHPVDAVYAVTVDRAVLEDRLKEMGGRGAAVLEYAADANGATYRIRHGIDEEQLPGLVKTFVGPGGIVVERSETWTRVADGYDGTVAVALPGTPGRASGVMSLKPAGEGTELHVAVEVTVNVPLVGGKIEEIVGQQIVKLLKMETDYTLARVPG